MNFFLHDFFATLGSVVVFLTLLLGAGALFARLSFPGFDEARGYERAGLALLCGLACLPVVLDWAGRLGVNAMAAVAGVLTLAGAPALLRGLVAKPSRGDLAWLGAGLVCVVATVLVLIDWPTADGLRHSFLVVDYVKHTETTWSIAQSATPPWNPAFYSPESKAVYYYFFYTLTAVVDLASQKLFGAEARHAAYASASVAAFALLALMNALWKRCGSDEAVGAEVSKTSAMPWLVALLLCAGLDLIPWLRMASVGEAPISPEAWAEQVTSWVSTALWVPHHVAALVAAFVGFIALARPAAPDVRRIVLAALAFASCAGLSVYIGMGAAMIAVLWMAAMAFARRFGDAARLALAGLGAAAFAVPWLATVAGRATADAPVAFALRNYAMLPFQLSNPVLDALVHIAAMLLVYLIEFGIFALGAFAFWQRAGRKGLQTDLGLVLALAAAASFLIGSFFRSTMLNNDLGWRIMLFAQAATLIWTLSAIRAGLLFDRKRLVSVASICLVLGYADIPISFVMLRTGFPDDPLIRATAVEERGAWAWLDARLPAGAVAQAQPMQDFAINFGLYGRFPSPVADYHEARLFGASERQIDARIADLKAIFSGENIGLADVEAKASRYRISAILVTARDEVFHKADTWMAAKPAAYATPRVRIYLFEGGTTSAPPDPPRP